MDEIEMVSSLRTDPVPTPETATRHKAQLRAALAASSNGRRSSQNSSHHRVAPIAGDTVEAEESVLDLSLRRSVDPGRRWPRRGRILAAAAALLAVGGVATMRSADDRPDIESAATGQAGGTCGSDLPFAFAAPAGFEGPVDGPAPEETFALSTPLEGQVVRHWIGPTGTVDVRWPSQDLVGEDALVDSQVVDAGTSMTTTTVLPDPSVAEDEITSLVVTDELPEGADVGHYNLDVPGAGEDQLHANPVGYSGEVSSPQLGEGACATVRLIVSANSAEAASALFTSSRDSLLSAIAEM